MIDYKEHISKIENFPIEGITYRDIQPLLANHTVLWMQSKIWEIS